MWAGFLNRCLRGSQERTGNDFLQAIPLCRWQFLAVSLKKNPNLTTKPSGISGLRIFLVWFTWRDPPVSGIFAGLLFICVVVGTSVWVGVQSTNLFP